MSQISQEKPVLESLFDKVAGLRSCNFIKKRLLTQVFSCEICEIFKNIYFEEHLRMTASKDSTHLGIGPLFLLFLIKWTIFKL